MEQQYNISGMENENNNNSSKKMPKWAKISIIVAILFLVIAIVVLVVVLVFALIYKNNQKTMAIKGMNELERPLENLSEEFNNIQTRFSGKSDITNPTIFVNIASYRDPELVVTLNDLYNKAYNRDRIFVGVVQQNDDSDDATAFAKNCIIPKNQLRIFEMHYSKAKGPTYARSICESLFREEEYYLLCDSHIRFEAGWDCEAIDNVLRCPRPKRTVITMYPEGFERKVGQDGKIDYQIKVRKGWRRQRFKYFNQQGIPEFESLNTGRVPPEQPEHTAFFAACFAFGHSDWLRIVPYHSETPFLFFGEEIFMGARLFTHGFDLRSPRYSICYHLWKRDYRKTYWSHDVISERDKSIQKIKDIMLQKVVDPNPKFNLGTKRSMDEFWDYVGVDFLAKITTRQREPYTLPANFKDIVDEFNVVPKYLSEEKIRVSPKTNKPKEKSNFLSGIFNKFV